VRLQPTKAVRGLAIAGKSSPRHGQADAEGGKWLKVVIDKHSNDKEVAVRCCYRVSYLCYIHDIERNCWKNVSTIPQDLLSVMQPDHGFATVAPRQELRLTLKPQHLHTPPVQDWL
jgi:hypothetical protein